LIKSVISLINDQNIKKNLKNEYKNLKDDVFEPKDLVENAQIIDDI
jgi:hypothetical protein